MTKISNLCAFALIFSAAHTAQSMGMPSYYLDANDNLVREDEPFLSTLKAIKPSKSEVLQAAGVAGNLNLVICFYSLLLDYYKKKYPEQKEIYAKKVYHLMNSILFEAAAYGRKEIFKFCLQHGGKFDHKNSFLHMAIDLVMNNVGQHALNNRYELQNNTSSISADFIKFLIKESGAKITKKVVQHITNEYDWHDAPPKAITLKNYVLKMYQQQSKKFAKVSDKTEGPNWLRQSHQRHHGSLRA